MAFRALCLLLVSSLWGCTSTQDLLEPSAISAADIEAAPTELLPPELAGGDGTVSTDGVASVDPLARASSADAAPAMAATSATGTRVQMAPIVGATVEASASLTRRMAVRARETGISLSGTLDPAATHVLKGYFSIITEKGEMIVVYVWDVYDVGGNRLYRINGKQSRPLVGDGTWASVQPETMEAAADEMMSNLVSWLDTQTRG